MSDRPPHQQPGWGPPDPSQQPHNHYGPRPNAGQYPASGDQWGPGGWSSEPGQPPEDPNDQRGRRGLILGIIAGIAAVVIIAGGFWIAVSAEDESATSDEGEEEQNEASSEEDSETSGEANAPAGPDAAAENYLTALAAGEFDEAFSYADQDPRGNLLTDQVLQESLELAPISNIEVEPTESAQDSASEHVSVTYTLGEQDISTELHMLHDYATDEWSVDGYGLGTQISPAQGSSMELTVNGEPIPADGADLLYGLAYQIDVDHENFTLTMTDDDSLIVADETYLPVGSAEIGLTEEATAEWAELIMEEAEECLASTTYESGCGLDMPEQVSGDQVIDDTVERVASTTTMQTFENLTPRLDYDNPNLVAPEEHLGSIDIFYDCSGPQGEGQCELLTGEARQFNQPVVDMAAEELEVVWE